MRRFEDKTVLITGSTKGIGLAATKLFLGEGAKVIGLANEQNSNNLGQNYNHYECSLADSIALDKCAKEILQDRQIDILINNAGISHYKEFLDLSREEFEETFKVNFVGHLFLTQHIIRQMIEQNCPGKIVFTSSVKGFFGAHEQIDYASSKAAIILAAKSLASAYGRNKININVVCPGSTETTLNPRLESDPEFKKERLERIPLGRLAQPEDIARAIAFLASSDADYITGTTLVVDGGWTCSI